MLFGGVNEMPRQTVTIDAELYKAMVFFVQGLAITGALKYEHGAAHIEVVKLARAIDAQPIK